MIHTILAKNLINNYVFQNRFKVYFNNDLEKILDVLSPISDIDKCKSSPYVIDGFFGTKKRTLNFPNLVSYAYAIQKIDSLGINDFGKMNTSQHNKMTIDYKSRKFKSNSYSSFLEEQINYLISDYDKLYKIDIQTFYKSIYTHVFEKIDNVFLKDVDKNIRIFNKKKTNGLLLGNLLSTYAANEVMENMAQKINKELKKVKVLYFSDQFYIFYNNIDYDDTEIYKKVEKVISEDYFEFKINEKDSIVYNHEHLIKERFFIKEVYDLFDIYQSRTKDIDESSENIIHFFNALIEKYYYIEENKRNSFLEVVLKNIFSSPINLYRLSRLLKKLNNDPNGDRIVSIFILLLKKHPSLIILYIEFGIWEVINNNSDYINKKKEEIKNYFEKSLIDKIALIDAVYYLHICYVLLDESDRKKFCLNFYKKNQGKNLLLDSIIVETCNIKEKKSIVLNYSFNEQDWLLNYTKFMQIRFYLPLTPASNCICKTLNNCKKKKIKIIKSLDEITFLEDKKSSYYQVILKFI